MNDDNPFGGDYPTMTPDVRRAALSAFLDWLTQYDAGLVLAADTTQHLREVVTDEEIAARITKFEDWESDQGVAAMERQMERD